VTSRDFCFWLQGFLELRTAAPTAGVQAGLSTEQVECVGRHLALVFKHEIDPSMGDMAHQAKLDETHAPKPKPKPAGHVHHSGSGLPPVYRC
jgi:hypothetical protein